MWFNFKHSRQLKAEIESWRQENLISGEQAEQLIRRYELDVAPPWYRRTDFILRALALLLAALGLLLIISQNWHRLPIPARSAIGLAPLLVSYLLGWIFLRRGQKESAELSFFMASLLFGVNIFLQAQIFHISAYYPDGILWWIIGSLPFAILLNSRLHHGLTEVLFLFWISQQLDYHQYAMSGPLLILTLLILLWRSANPLLLILFCLNTFLLLLNLDQTFFPENTFRFWSLFAAYSLFAARFLPLWKKQLRSQFLNRLADLFSWLIILTMFLAAFDGFNTVLYGKPIPWLALGVYAAAIIISGGEQRKYSLAIAALCGSFLAIHLAGSMIDIEPARFAGATAILANLILLAFAVFQISTGIRLEEKKHFMGGVFIIVLLAFARYLDFLDNYLLTGLTFIAASAFIYGLNQYWNKRYGS